MSAKLILEVRHVSKSFGGIKAINDVSFNLRQGQILGVIGPNGSGKTTLNNLITGFIKKDAGQIIFKGLDISKWPAYKIADAGLARTFQIMRPYPTLPVYKNLVPPLYSPRARRTARGKLGDRGAVAIDILEEVGFERDARVPYKLAGTLPLGYLKRLELCRCLALRPELIVCDEIFSGLSMSEIASMIPLMERLQDEGITLIMVEHRIKELFKLANKVLVLNFGEKIAEGDSSDIFNDEKVKRAYFGGETTYVFK
ncbi:MAG TPA: ABC transporter ATP-binding protein [Desulfotomaculum sp.]|nr:MAG: ABC transporter [Peptococcaceae bacterium BRH_c8a]KJS78649.1 MAG: ABC transporter [Desulfotomaculum sp. BICA1-6]HBX22134.1 ABC transporter ATP-binding protein [Desulfotomaculum sp.]